MANLVQGDAGPQLALRLAQCTERGQHPRNQDFHGACVPHGVVLQAKGAVVAIADGIGSSAVSHMASEIAVRSVLEDYFSTPESWSVKKSVQRVVAATNAWLHAQSHQAGHSGARRDAACACTLSVLVFKSCTAHVFHVGDARIYRLREGQLERLTQDHCMRLGEHSHLSRVLGVAPHVELDYQSQPAMVGDVYALMTDGVHDALGDTVLREALAAAHAPDCDLDCLAQQLVALARRAGSTDDATLQLVQVQALPAQQADDIRQFAGLPPCPPLLQVGQQLDGHTVLRQIHASSRSHVYLVQDAAGQERVMKVPSLDGRQDPAYLERLLLEDWLGRQIDSAHVVRSVAAPQRSHLYVLTEPVPGITLADWMRQHPLPSLDAVRAIIEPLARGLQALHRRDILHRDLRPENILVEEATGSVCIIDLGAAKAAGWQPLGEAAEPLGGMGTLAYTAPELFLGVPASPQSDLYALAAMAYQMLSGRLPYGTQAARARTLAAQRALTYTPVVTPARDLPVWLDDTLARALHPDPAQRFEALSEFVQGLRQPLTAVQQHAAWLERNPLRFWQGLSVLLTLALLAALMALHLKP